ncbi:hypothetical protein [Marinilabilia rubra]|uniref:DUF5125 domain-containing protein n=1 Tax=Marinilabilia rubra TaxID=2162893 RepID=A0A2U2B9L3_9BACT|nr:hypothetical protein [Marinilabilia rubra]PWD99755.1 hypothetical protein DDZ16_09060 [Marinilabilia rubra]
MNSLFKYFLIAGIFTLAFASCEEDEYGPRKESTPVIESAAVTPPGFTFGDSITLTASVSDPATELTNLTYEVVSANRVVSSGEILLAGESDVVSKNVFVSLLPNQEDNSDVHVNLVAHNILKGTSSYQIDGLTGNRPEFNQLYMVTENGFVNVLEPRADNSNIFQGNDLTLETSFHFKIAERLHEDNSIDYSGAVFGNVNGKVAMIDEDGESAFAFTPEADYTRVFTYDMFAFDVETTGSTLGEADLALGSFGSEDINGESFRTLSRNLENGKTYSLFGALADNQNVYNPDFFERTAQNKVTFLGETGDYTIYYNPVRKNIFVGVDNPSYPNYLLACGWGLGYPTKVSSEEIASAYPGHQRTHTDWGFDHVMKYVLLRRIDEGVYQGTFYTPGDHDFYADFKPFENTGWANEKKAGDFTFTGEQIISGDNNWNIPNGEDDPVITPSNYRFTVNLNDNTVHIEQITLY